MFEPFPLPPVPMSLTDWLSNYVEHASRRRHRCIGVLLLLDLHERKWGMAVPSQRCSRDAACWSAAREDFPGIVPHRRIGGSFQSRVLAAGEEVADAVPPVPGVHFVQLLDKNTPSIWCFIRTDDQTHHVQPQDVIVDDWDAALIEFAPRLQLL